MGSSIMKNRKGFTLVEVIVVAVIVAVLALVGIQLYQGYVVESQRNTAENLAASAAGFLQTAVNSIGIANTDAIVPNPLPGGQTWVVNLGGGPNVVTFTCPVNATITFTPPAGGNPSNVVATVSGVPSVGTYSYR